MKRISTRVRRIRVTVSNIFFKDLYTYFISIKIPSTGGNPRSIIIANGSLCQADDKLSHGRYDFCSSRGPHRFKPLYLDPIALTPQGIPLSDHTEAEKYHDSHHSGTAEESVTGGNSSLTEKTDKLMVKWNQAHTIWLNPHVMNKLRDDSHQKLEVEVIVIGSYLNSCRF